MRLLLALPLATFFTIIFAGPQKLEPVVFDEEGWIKETHSNDPAIEEYRRVRRSNGDAFHCTSWPKSANYGCAGGDDWTLLDKTTFGTSECKSLCLQHASGDGCCYARDNYGCYWKAGSSAKKGNKKKGHGFAITCLSKVPEQCQPKDSDSCLQSSASSWIGYTCSSSTKYCESWGKDMKRCCPESCKIEAFTETDCNSSSGKGTCEYPNDAQCPEIVETCSTTLPTKKSTDDCIPMSLRVKAEFFEKSVKKASKTEILTTSTSSFRSNYDKLAFSLSSSIGYKGFSGSAASAFEKVTSSVESFSGSFHRETSKEEEYKPGFLQIERVITTEVTINGKLAKTVEREFVDSVKAEYPESSEQLKQRAKTYINDNFGNLAGEEGAYLRGNVYTASSCVSHESHEIYKITLDIWDNDSCGSNYGPYIEVQSANGEKRSTAFHGPFSSGDKLIWDANGENRWGTNLLKVDEFLVTPRNGIIMFRFVGGGPDEFCPKTLTIFTKDGKRYQRSGMTDWVRKGKGENWRDAYER